MHGSREATGGRDGACAATESRNEPRSSRRMTRPLDRIQDLEPPRNGRGVPAVAECVLAIAPTPKLAGSGATRAPVAPFSAPSLSPSGTVKSPRANLTARAAYESCLGFVQQTF